MDNLSKYTIETFPASRISTIDIGAVGQEKHHIRALLELDVTDARKMLFEMKKRREKVSFTAWLISCIGRAAAEFPEIHGMRAGRRRVVLFDDVDVSIMIEREIQGKKVPLPYVIRKTNEKSIADICEEIRAGQRQAINKEGDHVLGERKNDRLMKLYYSLPGILRRTVWRQMIRNPFFAQKNMGTVMVTSVGMMARISGWVIPVSVHPLCFAVGSIVKKPGVVEDRMEIREFLYLTVLVDHDVIDGAPAARALDRLTKMIEGGYGLS